MIDIVLLVLKIGILLVLYLFVWFVVRRAGRDVFSGSSRAGEVASPEPPDIALPTDVPVAPVSAVDRFARRAKRENDRTMGGEVLDFTAHISPRLVVEQSPIVPPGVIFPLEGWITVGRSPHSDIILDEPFVSSTHARLIPQGQFYVVEDLGSTNGTFLNEKEVTEAQLRLDSRLRIGETVFRYEE
jgi:hypothetical protein